MISLSSVIKSRVVVDRRRESPEALAPDVSLCDRTVIKRNHVPAFHRAVQVRSRDAYLDELNTLIIEIEEEKKEQAELAQQTEEIKAEVKILEIERDRLKKYEGLNIEEEVANKIKAAEQEAEKIKADALAEAKTSSAALVDSLKAQAYLEGLEQGAGEARQQIREENKPGIEKLGQLIEKLTAAKDELIAENEKDIVELVMSIAEKVVGRHLADDPKAVVDMLREAMEANRREQYVKVTLSKDLMPVTAKASDQVKKLIESLGQQVDVVVDPEMPRGSLIVESPGSFTDLSVGTQLGNIREAMQEAETAEEEVQQLGT